MSKLNTPETLATITMLAIRWPLAFWVLETRRRPLKVGIHLDVMAAGGFEEAAPRDALRAYTINAAYRRNLIAKAERVALDSSVAGWVTPEQAAIAREQNDAFFRRVRQRQERNRPSAPQVAPNPTGGRFSSCQSSDRRKRGEWHKWQKYSCGASRRLEVL